MRYVVPRPEDVRPELEEEGRSVIPVIRIELPSTRVAAPKVLALYQAGARDRALEDEAVEGACRLGRSPSGEVRFVGVVNGQPPRLAFDVGTDSEVR
ncbi:hypothetical protein [Georgenia sp. Z1491]|uniref:hypothetical protein n=1 Tax=Georgenia sp. Z1491 TaxID=3416707 RepID=UPI003CF1D8F3